ncbi:membrane protein [Gordoniibacillus kamchatkensis]|uniref:Membrane protein n=1 Tax=Gordoniibacillus kamchatkensis TaxID=1590651 RepID=A0ABR5AJ68_9BACL|nr:membrane protein [Paenibacillus sp. VKM B-2647]
MLRGGAFPEASDIEGFDIELDESSAGRIDRLVNDYEETILQHLNSEYVRTTTWADRIADRMVAFGGSWPFIVVFAVLLVAWIVWNVLPFMPHFDPAPFILLNLMLSLLAAFQAPVIMMSQNRQAARDKNESIIDFAINYKAEQEIDDMQNHLHRIEGELREVKKLLLELKGRSE